MADTPIILWLRQDLRLKDHPALTAAAATGRPVVPVYVLDDVSPGTWSIGGASRWWLGMTLPTLGKAFERIGSRLIVRHGAAIEELDRLADETKASGLYFTRSTEPWAAMLEQRLKAHFTAKDTDVRRFGGSLLFEPEDVKTGNGGPFKVYSPFARAVMELPEPREPLPAPTRLAAPQTWPESVDPASLHLLPRKPDWAGGLRTLWKPGEDGAQERLTAFLAETIGHYDKMRDRPDIAGTSRLSPHLHFGEISPNTCWHEALRVARRDPKLSTGAKKFNRELLWREFSSHLLHHFPTLPEKPFRANFEAFPWVKNDTVLAAWQKGLTGYPIVDAGMRELWQTGYMHNRVRMITGSFLVKDLLLPWQDGEAWFWDTLVDADLANNAASWQWIAGSGADAAPYFRIFNPIKQGQTFDPEGAYVRRFVPELQRLPSQYIHAPFEAPPRVLALAGVELGVTYPGPLVDHRVARTRALAAFAKIKTG